MKATIEGPYGEFSKLDAVRQVAIMRALRGRDEDVRVKTDELAMKEGEIQQLQQQLEQAQVTLASQESVYAMPTLIGHASGFCGLYCTYGHTMWGKSACTKLFIVTLQI